MADTSGRTWTRTEKTVDGDTGLLPADPTRAGMIVYPHATIDIYISISGATATGAPGDGMHLVANVGSGNKTPLTLVGNDCPTNEVRAYSASSADIKVDTRRAQRD